MACSSICWQLSLKLGSHFVSSNGFMNTGSSTNPFMIARINRAFLPHIFQDMASHCKPHRQQCCSCGIASDPIPRRILTALRGPFADLVRILHKIREQHASCRAWNDFVAIEGNAAAIYFEIHLSGNKKTHKLHAQIRGIKPPGYPESTDLCAKCL